jgi:drug/metabolite transporter (DMT)-like permease
VAPFLAAGFGWAILRLVPSRNAVLTSLVALFGAVIMVGFGREGRLTGDLLALGMTAAVALIMVIPRARPGIPTLPAAAASALLSTLAALPFSTALAEPMAVIPMLAAFGLVNSALGLALFLKGSSKIAPVETALITALDAPLAPLWVWLIFSETPGTVTLVGAGIILCAVFGHIWTDMRNLPLR